LVKLEFEKRMQYRACCLLTLAPHVASHVEEDVSGGGADLAGVVDRGHHVVVEAPPLTTRGGCYCCCNRTSARMAQVGQGRSLG
jgi:hypothetical protein